MPFSVIGVFEKCLLPLCKEDIHCGQALKSTFIKNFFFVNAKPEGLMKLTSHMNTIDEIYLY